MTTTIAGHLKSDAKQPLYRTWSTMPLGTMDRGLITDHPAGCLRSDSTSLQNNSSLRRSVAILGLGLMTRRRRGGSRYTSVGFNIWAWSDMSISRYAAT